MNCKYCGGEMKKAEKFCSSCGRYIEENDKPADPAKRKKNYFGNYGSSSSGFYRRAVWH